MNYISGTTSLLPDHVCFLLSITRSFLPILSITLSTSTNSFYPQPHQTSIGRLQQISPFPATNTKYPIPCTVGSGTALLPFSHTLVMVHINIFNVVKGNHTSIRLAALAFRVNQPTSSPVQHKPTKYAISTSAADATNKLEKKPQKLQET